MAEANEQNDSSIDHSECEKKALLERRTDLGLTEDGANRETVEEYWAAVRATMPPYFWNRIRITGSPRLCEWCNQPLDEKKS